MIDKVCSCHNCQHKLCTKRVSIFSTLDPDETGRVTDLIVRKRYQKGEMVFMEGSQPESLIIINEGRVKAFKYTTEGREQILHIFSQGDFLGEKNLLGRQEVTYSVEALEYTSICMINKKDFRQLLREHPEIGFKVMEELADRLESLENVIQNMGTKDAEIRVSMVLLEFSKKYGKDSSRGRIIELPLSREGIANYIGVTRETVSRKLSHLQEEGIIELVGNRKIIIVDQESLKESVQA